VKGVPDHPLIRSPIQTVPTCGPIRRHSMKRTRAPICNGDVGTPRSRRHLVRPCRGNGLTGRPDSLGVSDIPIRSRTAHPDRQRRQRSPRRAPGDLHNDPDSSSRPDRRVGDWTGRRPRLRGESRIPGHLMNNITYLNSI
jgi:hypothetical protein